MGANLGAFSRADFKVLPRGPISGPSCGPIWGAHFWGLLKCPPGVLQGGSFEDFLGIVIDGVLYINEYLALPKTGSLNSEDRVAH